MKTFTLQNRLAVLSIIALFVVAVFLVVESQPAETSVLANQTPSSLANRAEDGVVAQIESVFSISARHVFDEDYWIANMHSIKSF